MAGIGCYLLSVDVDLCVNIVEVHVCSENVSI